MCLPINRCFNRASSVAHPHAAEAAGVGVEELRAVTAHMRLPTRKHEGGPTHARSGSVSPATTVVLDRAVQPPPAGRQGGGGAQAVGRRLMRRHAHHRAALLSAPGWPMFTVVVQYGQPGGLPDALAQGYSCELRKARQ